MKISVIVPIYNMECYLRRCLDSLIVQSYSDLEIIAINDGSTDKSLDILYEYAQRDSRIIVIEKENNGVSSARNMGIEMATGAYIGFVDPDDWIDENMYESMYSTAIKRNADIVMCTYVREFGEYSKVKKFNCPREFCYKGEEVQLKMMRRLIGPLKDEIANPEFLDAWGTVWSKLYRTEILKNNNVNFTDLNVIGTNEDSLFNIYAFYYAEVFVFLNEPYYHYWKTNEKSVTSRYKPNLVDQWFTLYKIIENFLKEKMVPEEFYVALNNRICLNVLGLGLNMLSEGEKISFITKIKKLRLILNDKRIKRSFRGFDLKYFPVYWKVFYFCAKFRFSFGVCIILVLIDRLRKLVR
ncbi:glycosyltransferase family 2 protein [Bacillus luti]|uniref:glycosyltransferase family 2 protein n=1 Tax=Bacillus luti TaxID=2026191 RepID=UPI0012E7F62B|nr:glycosyltransferase [Bacillus luti]